MHGGCPAGREHSKGKNLGFIPPPILGFSVMVQPMLHYVCSLSIVVNVLMTQNCYGGFLSISYSSLRPVIQTCFQPLKLFASYPGGLL